MKQILYLDWCGDKGWGVKTKYDIPKGTYISQYVGALYTPTQADIVGKISGDEFLCDLDAIEVNENQKGLLEDNTLDSAFDESDESVIASPVARIRTLRSRQNPTKPQPTPRLSNLIFNPAGKDSGHKMSAVEKSYKEKISKNLPSSSSGQGGSELVANESQEDLNLVTTISKTRSYYVEQDKRDIEKYSDDIDKFVLDCKNRGNLGRFFNHSCDANMQAVTVYTFTRDLLEFFGIFFCKILGFSILSRTCPKIFQKKYPFSPCFPVISFFTNRVVKAEQELTWFYGSDYGSNCKPDDRIGCMCGTANCLKDRISFKKISYR